MSDFTFTLLSIRTPLIPRVTVADVSPREVSARAILTNIQLFPAFIDIWVKSQWKYLSNNWRRFISLMLGSKPLKIQAAVEKSSVLNQTYLLGRAARYTDSTNLVEVSTLHFEMSQFLTNMTFIRALQVTWCPSLEAFPFPKSSISFTDDV